MKNYVFSSYYVLNTSLENLYVLGESYAFHQPSPTTPASKTKSSEIRIIWATEISQSQESKGK